MYREADAVIVVYDQANEKSFASIKFWLNEVDKYASENTRKFVVCNKTDLNALVPAASGKAYAEGFRLPFFEVSAKLDTNVDALFQAIVHSVGERDHRGEEWSKFKIAKSNGGGSSSSSSGGNANNAAPPKKKTSMCTIL